MEKRNFLLWKYVISEGEYKQMGKLKPLLPSLKEKKRYLAFNVITKAKSLTYGAICDAINNSFKELYGEVGLADAGLIFVKDKFNKKTMTGIVRVNNKLVDKLKLSLSMIKKIDNTNVVVRSVGVSGVLKKAEEKYLK